MTKTFTRRGFLTTTALSAAAASLPRVLQAETPPASVAPGTTKKTGGHYLPPHRMGLGGVAIGSAFRPTTDEEAQKTMQGAWEAGVRFFDTSPWYGLGLSERRMGHFLHNQKRSDYVLSTKVGRLLTAGPRVTGTIWKDPAPFEYRYDYTAEGTRRSIEDSLQRLGIESIDIVFIHDLSSDNPDMKEKWTEYFDIAAKGAMRELSKMRDEGLIKAWGFGVNTIEPALAALKAGDPDVFLSATQYSLMYHENALNTLFPACEERGVSIVVGAPLNAGFLAGVERYNYGGTIPEGFEKKRARMAELARDHGTDLRTAALQFSAAPAVVSSTIPGARSGEQVTENAASMKAKIPAAFWEALKGENLIAKNAPIPPAA